MTLDMNMPEMNGVEVLKSLSSDLFVPAVVVSSLGLEQGGLVLEAMQEGAVDYFPKPSLADVAKETPALLEKLEAASKLQPEKLVAQRMRQKARTPKKSNLGSGVSGRVSTSNQDSSSIIAIGASTGGTEAIRELLQELPKNVPPVVIVQHIPPVFSAAFAKRLQATCDRPVFEVRDGQTLQWGHCYVAPGDRHFSVRRNGKDFVCCLLDTPNVNGHKPSVDALFDSIAELRGCNITAVLLTGMGKDGAMGLKKLRQKGARTICQSERSCVVYGMPRAAVELGAAEFVEDLTEIANRVVQVLEAA
jgi:two-component system chemotaxis response regulator CheB